jgi:hypothetical protein
MAIRPSHLYTVGLSLLALLAIAGAATQVGSWPNVLVLGLLAWGAASLTTSALRSVGASLSGVISVAAFVIVGPAGAVVAASSVVFVLLPDFPFVKRIYNASQTVIDTLAGGVVFAVIADRTTPLTSVASLRLVIACLAAYAVLLLVNALLLSGVLKLDLNAPPLEVLRGTLAPTFFPMMGYGALGVLLAVLWLGGLGPAAALFMLLPLFVGRWAFAQAEAEEMAHSAAIEALARIVEAKDLYTRGHSDRVSHGVLQLSKVLGLDDARHKALGYAGLLHDVGKVGVPLSVLRKSGRLTDDEMDEIRLHPSRGFDLVGKIVFLEEAQKGILHHHERYDGSGYPSGLAGHDIPEFGRIIAVADAFDSMTTSRSYRGARSVEEARAELERCRGTHFDPVMVDAFAESLDRYGWAPVGSKGLVAVLAGDPTIDHDDLAGVGSVPESAAADPALVALSAAGPGSDPAPPA